MKSNKVFIKDKAKYNYGYQNCNVANHRYIFIYICFNLKLMTYDEENLIMKLFNVKFFKYFYLFSYLIQNFQL